MVSRSALMKQVFDAIKRAALSNLPVLITGESGVGKELVAGELHRLSRSRSGALVPINCGALPGELAESELFGHVRGAFTGATSMSKGAFVAAENGTLFLDEIGELPTMLQPKLLRALETLQVRPVGATQSRRVNVRLVAATHQNLQAMASEGRFRNDLIFRIDVLRIDIPALRERPEDIEVLAYCLLQRHEFSKSIDAEAFELLRAYDWPGNIRELRNVLLRAAVSAQHTITKQNISNALPRAVSTRVTARCFKSAGFEFVGDILKANGGNRKATYDSLRVPKSTFYRWLRQGKIPDVRGAIDPLAE